MNFDAVILAGGKSTRMGRDKAWLEFGGQSLLARQIQLAREIGAGQIFISGHPNVNYSFLGCSVLADEFQNAGPLAGIARALGAGREPLLLVLAVDMANMSADFLTRLQAGCGDGTGCIPVCAGIIEPLAAFYPQSAAAVARRLLESSTSGNSPGATDFAKACAEAGVVRFFTVPPMETGRLKSWNLPADVTRAS